MLVLLLLLLLQQHLFFSPSEFALFGYLNMF
jgi:hypothetical protein